MWRTDLTFSKRKIMQIKLIKNIIKVMKNKIYKGNRKKLDEIEAYRAHFGWKRVSRDNKTLTLGYDTSRKHLQTLRRLEKQADIIHSRFPTRAVLWFILCIIFLVPYFFYKDGVLFGVLDFKSIVGEGSNILSAIPLGLLVLGGINGFFTVYELITFFVLKFTKKTSLEAIYKIADALSGVVIDAPLMGNIEPNRENSGILSTINITSATRK